jgi:hypothetical protein
MFAKNKLFVLAAMAAFAFGVIACGGEEIPSPTTDIGLPDAPSGDTGGIDIDTADVPFDTIDLTYEEYCERCLAEDLECLPEDELRTKSAGDPQIIMIGTGLPCRISSDPCEPYYDVEGYLWSCDGIIMIDGYPETISDEVFQIDPVGGQCLLFGESWEVGIPFGSVALYHEPDEISIRRSDIIDATLRTCTGARLCEDGTVAPCEEDPDPCEPYYEIEEYLWTCESTSIENEDFYVEVRDDHCEMFDETWAEDEGAVFGQDVLYEGGNRMTVIICSDCIRECQGVPR